jgi:hypothetical protein
MEDEQPASQVSCNYRYRRNGNVLRHSQWIVRVCAVYPGHGDSCVVRVPLACPFSYRELGCRCASASGHEKLVDCGPDGDSSLPCHGLLHRVHNFRNVGGRVNPT